MKYNLHNMTKAGTTNPAHRASTFVKLFSQAAAPPADQRNARTVRHTIARMYNINSDDTARIVDVIGQLWRIPGDIRSSLDKVEGLETSVYDPTISQFETMLLSLELKSDAMSIKSQTPASLENTLEMISAYLNLHDPETLPSETGLNKLLKDIQTLSSEIKSTDLDKDFIDYFLHRLDELSYALNHYDTLGPTEVIRRVDEMFGSLVRELPEISKSPKKKGIAGKLWAIAQAAALIVNLTNGSFKAIENYNQLTGIEQSTTKDKQK